METETDVPEDENQWHGARVFAVALKSQSDELFVREKEWRRLRAQRVGISTLCLGLADKISSGSHRARRAPCYPLTIADRDMSQSLGRGKLETKVSQP